MRSYSQGRASQALLFLSFSILILWPYFNSGFYFDDSFNSLIHAKAVLSNQSLVSLIWSGTTEWMRNAARFYPMAHALTLPIYFWTSRLSYRIFQVSFVISNILLFMAVIRELGDRSLAALFGVVILGFFQARNFYDPITSFACLLQFVFFFGTLSVLLLLRGRIAPAVIFYACGLLTYELSLTYLALISSVCMTTESTDWRGKLKTLAPFIAVTTVWLGINFYLRNTQFMVYPGNRVALTYKSLVAFFYQLSGAFPLSYPFFARSEVFGWKDLGQLFSVPVFLAFCASTAAAYWAILNASREAGPRNPRVLSLFAVSLIALPPLFIAISEKYQNTLVRPGHAYLPVFLSYFGVALALCQGLAWFVRREVRPKWVVAIIASSLGGLIAFNRLTNTIAIEYQNERSRYPHEFVEGALKAGILGHLGEHPVLLLPSFSWWFNRYFVFTAIGMDIDVESAIPYVQSKGSRLSPAQIRYPNTYFIQDHYLSRGTGWVLLSPVKQVSWTKSAHTPEITEQLTSVNTSDSVDIFVQSLQPIRECLVTFRPAFDSAPASKQSLPLAPILGQDSWYKGRLQNPSGVELLSVHVGLSVRQ